MSTEVVKSLKGIGINELYINNIKRICKKATAIIHLDKEKQLSITEKELDKETPFHLNFLLLS